MTAGIEQHALEQDAVALLAVDALGERAAGVAQLVREPVAQLLELAEGQQARSGCEADGRSERDVDAGAREGGYQRLLEIALQSRDLLAEVTPCGALVER